MRLPPIKRILREDVKDAPTWIGGIIDPINSFMENVYQSLNKNITYSENLAAFIKELTYKTTSSYPVVSEVEFTNELKFKATGIQVLQTVERTTYIPAVAGVAWIENNGKIIITNVTGLAADKTYTIRLLVS